ncbi:hypothetical protein PENSOL_c006G08645 [Penicillium solitum]|uniref:Major facilitator superfamily (MFS) profile domain-containing protein n=1 Tax=Penicillium solitum TaxID=60172 RepID=A0A1V6RE32_9EURO|nr:uncharacterized protein PENSOL_c006G08645 [Penicillium solitum]OQD99436.1 hypothetical protein PENSOL_c006G08645 [Penicillium solitum]
MDQLISIVQFGSIGPLQPKSSKLTITLLVTACCIFAVTTGYDAGLMNGINMMPQYVDWFQLTTVTKSLSICSSYFGWFIAAIFMGPVVECTGRKGGIFISVILKLIGIALMASSQSVGMFIGGRIILGWAKGTAAIASATWLAETLPADAYHNREDEALQVLASIYSSGDITCPVATAQHWEILNAMRQEQESGKTLSYVEMVRTSNSRKRLILVVSVAVISMLAGNNIVSYYLGDMLTTAGLYNNHVQLQVTIVLNSWALVCAMSGTMLTDKIGRKTLCLSACIMMTIGLLLVGILTKFFGSGTHMPGVYATIAMIFVFQGSYSFGIAPITQLYPPEVLNYSIRANGMAVWTLVVNLCGLLSTLAMPIALEAIGWKMYMINGAWDALQAIFVALVWIETKNLSLEDIDRVIDGMPLNGVDPEGDYDNKDTKDPNQITEHEVKTTRVKRFF